jgi:hypothetical protein
VKDTNATVSVFKGDVEVASASSRVKVEKKHSATFALAGTGNYTLANNLEPDPYDEWDKQQEKYHQQYSASNSYSPYAYGASDLNYYGSFYNVPGYGMMWQPFLVGAGWDPFMNGAWTWYPGAGYTWVSAYPWGWMPYRYGSWTYLANSGWFWQPGSTWAGWNNVPRIVNAPQRFSIPRPPATPGQTLLVNRGMPSGPVRIIDGRSAIRGDSAGLGVARGSVRNLGRISQQIDTRPAPMAGSAARMPTAGSPRAVTPRGAPQTRSAPAPSAAPRMSGGSGAGSSASSSRGNVHK